MADIKLSALPAIAAAALTDIIASVQGGVTYKATLTQIRAALMPIVNADVSGTIAAAKVAPGANTEVLTTTGGVAGWAAPAGSGPWAFGGGVGTAAVGGTTCTAIGANAVCYGFGSTSDGDGSITFGYSNTGNQTYCQTIGSYNNNWGIAGTCLGESNNLGTAGTFPSNATIIGYSNTNYSDFSSIIGSYCQIAPASAVKSVALGYGATIDLPGQMAQSSGHPNVQGGNWMDLYRELVAAAGNMQMVDGNPFTLPTLSVISMRVRLMAVKTAGAAKFACETHELTINVQAGAMTIVRDTTIDGAGTIAAQGWAVVISAVFAGLELRFACNSGADTVRFMARLEWSKIGNL